MTILDEEEALLLARARRAFTPERQQTERVHAAVLAAVFAPQLGEAATGGADGAGAAGAGKALGTMHGLGVWGAKTWFLAALTIGAASGAGLWAFRASEPAPVADSATGRNESPARALPAATSRESTDAPKPSSPPAVTPARTAVLPVVEPEREVTARAPATPRATPTSSETPGLTLRDELDGVREAERALNAGAPGRALSILEELQRHPGGNLREERAALRVLANCQLATSMSGEQARRFLRTYPDSLYAPRIRARCP